MEKKPSPPSTPRALQAHEMVPPHSVAPRVDGLRQGSPIEQAFAGNESRKQEFYALLSLVIERTWNEVHSELAQLADTDQRRVLSEDLLAVVECQQKDLATFFREQPFTILSAATFSLFEDYRQRFTRLLAKHVEAGLQPSPDPVYARLQTLMKEGASQLVDAETVEQEIMAGFDAAGSVIMFTVNATPNIFYTQFQRLPSVEEWLSIARRSGSLLITMASKEFSRFNSMNVLLDKPVRKGELRNSIFWNDRRFLIEGETKDEWRLGIVPESLEELRAERATQTQALERVGCPALYARSRTKGNVIQSMHEALVGEVEKYIAPHYGRLTADIGRERLPDELI